MVFDTRPPEILYKYRPLETKKDLEYIREILEGSLYFNSPIYFNDPMDSCIPLDNQLTNEEVDRYIEKLEKTNQKPFQKNEISNIKLKIKTLNMSQLAHEFIKDYSVCSLQQTL